MLYGRGLEMSALDLDELVSRTEGVSAAFIKELLRRAALNAAIRSRSEGVLALRQSDVLEALHEIVATGGVLTKRLLGAA